MNSVTDKAPQPGRETVHSRPVLECRHLSKRFDDAGIAVQVLKDINLSVAQGERIAIIGRSGAGKSTLLHLLGGLDTPSGGEVWVEGHTAPSQRGRARQAAQSLHGLYLSVPSPVGRVHRCGERGHAAAGTPRAAGVRAGEGTALSEKVGLGDRLRHKPGELSGGERQRAAVARALVTSPRCILADEPTGNLDLDTADQVHQLLVDLNREFNTSFIVVTHNLALSRLMERTYVLEHGLLGLKTINGSKFTE